MTCRTQRPQQNPAVKSFTSTSDTDTYTFVHDPTAGVPAVIEEISPTGSIVKYIREPGRILIAHITGSGETETIQYYHFDEQGSVIFLTDSTGEVIDRYTYDDWGNTTHVGTTYQPYQYIGARGYYTHYQDQNLKQMQLGFRFYDPKIGRFTQLDPIGDGINWYAYCGGDPKNGVDPWGLVDDPGFWEGMIPVYGSGKAAIHDLENHDFWGYMFNATMAVTDVFLVRAAVVAIGKVGIKAFAIKVLSPRVALKNMVTKVRIWWQSRKAVRYVRKFADCTVSTASGLRANYVREVNRLADVAESMRASGKNSEEIARTLTSARRKIGIRYKRFTLPEELARIHNRNLIKYNDKLGPTIEWFRNHDKTWEEIIESSSRTGGADLGY